VLLFDPERLTFGVSAAPLMTLVLSWGASEAGRAKVLQWPCVSDHTARQRRTPRCSPPGAFLLAEDLISGCSRKPPSPPRWQTKIRSI
jgi:hypothetical protein